MFRHVAHLRRSPVTSDRHGPAGHGTPANHLRRLTGMIILIGARGVRGKVDLDGRQSPQRWAGTAWPGFPTMPSTNSLPRGTLSLSWMNGRRRSPDTTCTTPPAVLPPRWALLSRPCVRCSSGAANDCSAHPRRTARGRERTAAPVESGCWASASSPSSTYRVRTTASFEHQFSLPAGERPLRVDRSFAQKTPTGSSGS